MTALIRRRNSPEPITDEIIKEKGIRSILLDKSIEVRYPLDIGKGKKDNKQLISVVIPDSRLKKKISLIILSSWLINRKIGIIEKL
jgi:hypothetical protein